MAFEHCMGELGWHRQYLSRGGLKLLFKLTLRFNQRLLISVIILVKLKFLKVWNPEKRVFTHNFRVIIKFELYFSSLTRIAKNEILSVLVWLLHFQPFHFLSIIPTLLFPNFVSNFSGLSKIRHLFIPRLLNKCVVTNILF